MSYLPFALERVLPRAFPVAARRWLAPLALLFSSGLITPAAAADEPPKVLLVVSSEGQLDAAGKQQRPGFEMNELAQAWLVLRASACAPAIEEGAAAMGHDHDTLLAGFGYP